MQHGVDAAKKLWIIGQRLPLGWYASGGDEQFDGIGFQHGGHPAQNVFFSGRIAFTRQHFRQERWIELGAAAQFTKSQTATLHRIGDEA